MSNFHTFSYNNFLKRIMIRSIFKRFFRTCHFEFVFLFPFISVLLQHGSLNIIILFSSKRMVGFIVFSATFNNISVISWRSGLLVEETGVHGRKHRHVASHWQTLLHNVGPSTLHHEQGSNSTLLGVRQRLSIDILSQLHEKYPSENP